MANEGETLLARRLRGAVSWADHLDPERIVAHFCSAVVLGIMAGLVAATLAYELGVLTMSRFRAPYPGILYGLLYVPGSSRVAGARGAAGADFSQVYTSALALRHGESAYRPVTAAFKDFLGRPPGYPPLVNWVAVPLTYLRYTDAFLLHTALSLLGLMGASAFVLWRAGLARHIGRVVAAHVCLYFLTPVGMTHLERGQFDLIVAAAGVLAVGCAILPEGSLGMALLSGFLGAVKWTSVAFLGCFSVLGFLLATGRRRLAFLAIPFALALGTFPFWKGLNEYWTTIRVFEIEAHPYGLTLQHLMPRPVARAVPVGMTLLVLGLVFRRSRSRPDRDAALNRVAAPFSMALMNVAVCYGTLSFEYHTVATLGMIPGLVLWTEQARGVAGSIKAVTCAAFGLFLLIAFRPYGVTLSPRKMTAMYTACALFFLGVSLAVVGPRRRGALDPAPL